ncbi:thioredoxin family protein [Tundrisphaera lichenicola]|uniref:thioredoxin family protein n=1 Tax=Tundrisphaera lichenicola TaxID=2029860 RepID=UPI003EBAB543
MFNLASRRIRVGLGAFLALGLLGSPLTHSSIAADEVRNINWRDDLAKAQAEAKSRDLLLWIQFTGPWCINCRRMDRSTFVHPSVILESVERFVPVKLRSDEHESLALSLGLSSLPSTVIVRPDGEVIDKFEGYIDPEHFEAALTALLRREGRTAEQIASRKKKPGKDESVALAGYCPVSLLREQKLVPGRPELSLEHHGRTFRFADEATRLAFLAKPDSFAPANSGRCPVSQVDRGDFHPGDPRWGVVYAGHLFLFKDDAERQRFVKDPERYANVGSTDRNSCPHCWNRSAVVTRRGPSRFSTAVVTQGLNLPVANRIAEIFSSMPTLRR